MRGTHCTPDQYLGRKRESIEEIGTHRHKVHQDGIRGENYLTLPRSLSREPAERKNQGHRPNHDVAVDGNRPLELLRHEDSAQLPSATESPQMPCRDHQPDGDGKNLGYDGTQCHPAYIPSKTNHEHRIKNDIAQVQYKLQDQPEIRAAQSNEPPQQRIIRERRRRGPDSDVEVFTCKSLDLV